MPKIVNEKVKPLLKLYDGYAILDMIGRVPSAGNLKWRILI